MAPGYLTDYRHQKLAGIIEDKYANTLNLCIMIQEGDDSSHPWKWEVCQDSTQYISCVAYGYAASYDQAIFCATKKIRKLLKAAQPKTGRKFLVAL